MNMSVTSAAPGQKTAPAAAPQKVSSPSPVKSGPKGPSEETQVTGKKKFRRDGLDASFTVSVTTDNKKIKDGGQLYSQLETLVNGIIKEASAEQGKAPAPTEKKKDGGISDKNLQLLFDTFKDFQTGEIKTPPQPEKPSAPEAKPAAKADK